MGDTAMVTQMAIPILGSLISGFLVWVIHQANQGLSSLISAKLDGAAQTTALAALNRLQSVAEMVVGEMNQTVVADLKFKAYDGKLTLDEVNQVGGMAADRVKTILGQQGMQALSGSTGDVDAIIKSALESQICKIK